MSDIDEGGPSAGAGEHDLPRSTVYKLIADATPDGMGCAKDCKDLIAECAKEFITLIAMEANEISEKTAKKTMNPEHVSEALKKLGFQGYIAECEEVSKDNVEVVKDIRQRKSKANKSGMTDEEMAAEQEKLFAAARARMIAGES